MIKFRSIYNLFFCALLLLLIAILADIYFLSPERQVHAFQKKVFRKENIAKEQLRILVDDLIDSTRKVDYHRYKKFNEEGIFFLCYIDDNLAFWSDNHINIDFDYDDRFNGKLYLSFNNGDYVIVKKETNHIKVVSLIQITEKYSYQNEYLKNGFHESYSLIFEMELAEKDQSESYPIYNNYGEYLFSISPKNIICQNARQIYLNAIFYLLAFLFLCFFFYSYLRRERNFLNRRIYILSFGVFLVLLRFFMITYKLPASVYGLGLFGPTQYASSFFFPSLGDFVLNTFFFFLFAYAFSKYYELSKFSQIKLWFYTILCSSLIIFGILFYYIICLVKSLIFDSNLSLQIHSISNLNQYSIWGLLGITFFFYGFLLGIDILTQWSYRHIKLSRFYLICFLCTACTGLLFYYKGESIFHVFFLSFLLLLYGSFIYFKHPNLRYSITLLLYLITAVYLVFFIGKYSTIKERRIRKIAAKNLSAEYDPVSMSLLSDISKQLRNDPHLLQYIINPYENENLIKDQLLNEYFTNYWELFDIRITLCNESDKISFEEDNNPFDCFSFFADELKNQNAQLIPETDFYVLNVFDGKIAYIGILNYSSTQFGTVNIYIEISSMQQNEGLGYPDLLLDSKYTMNKNIGQYSYAKYYHNKLIASSGEYDYYWSLIDFGNNNNNNKSHFFEKEGYNHYLHVINENEKVVVSNPLEPLSTRWINFPYVFIMLFIFGICIWLVEHFPWKYPKLTAYRERIQIAFVSMLLLFFLFLVFGSLYFSFKQFNQRNFDELSDKLKFIKNEALTHIISKDLFETSIQNELPFMLRNYSNILKTDINIYNAQGFLVATSRPEIFKRGLLGNKINAYAYYQLMKQRKAQVVNKEHIGKLQYSSAYVTLYDYDNNPICYLNLPYFLRYKEHRLELLTLIMGAVNLYLFIILIAIFLSIIISNRLTSSLKLLQNKIKKVMLVGKNEQILYHKEDEIKSLINAYNRMVEELEESANMLAQSERESAWREMAKQVAHEIKNPLTPMRLSIQFLQKAWVDKSQNLDKQFQKTANILIEQIDHLSNIATAFSNFAKMPKGNNRVTNLIDIIQQIVDLYKNMGVNIHLTTHRKNIPVFVDPEQFKRVYMNLIKNAQQSIVDKDDGKIKVSAKIDNGKVISYVKDNGNGIYPQNREHIFMPNFTTKSGGMGLGLAIAKNIVNDAKGRIWFESEYKKGATFFVELVLYNLGKGSVEE